MIIQIGRSCCDRCIGQNAAYRLTLFLQDRTFGVGLVCLKGVFPAISGTGCIYVDLTLVPEYYPKLGGKEFAIVGGNGI